MGIYSVFVAVALVSSALGSTPSQRVPLCPYACLGRLRRHGERLIEIAALAISVACVALPASASAQTITLKSLTAGPTTVQRGQTVVFTATMTSNANASNYPVEFSLNPAGVTGSINSVSYVTFQAGASLTKTFSWTVPSSTPLGLATLVLAVYNPAWHVPALVQKSITFTVAAAGGTQQVGIAAGGSPAASHKRHGPSRQSSHVDNRNLDGRILLLIQMGRKRRADRRRDSFYICASGKRRRA